MLILLASAAAFSQKTFEFTVEGMSCETCAETAYKVLQFDGVISVSVDFETKKAIIPPTKALTMTSRVNCCQFWRRPSWTVDSFSDSTMIFRDCLPPPPCHCRRQPATSCWLSFRPKTALYTARATLQVAFGNGKAGVVSSYDFSNNVMTAESRLIVMLVG